jgi:flagella basal body P-ring formation protein FlgA
MEKTIMSNKIVKTILIMYLLLPVNSNADNTEKDSALQIYLPREITIKNKQLSLGQVGIIRGQESLVAKASKITLGQISAPGQKVVINREIVLSRLACSGIPLSKVTLTGAETVTIKQQERTIRGDEFIKLASSFLEKNPPGISVCGFNPMRIPKDFIITGTGKNISFSPRLVSSRARNQAKVEVAIHSGGKKIGTSEIIFRLKYNCRQVVTKIDISTGTVISPDNVKIEKAILDYPEPADWKPPYGLIAKRQIPAKTLLHPNMLGPFKSPIITKRNQKVVIRIDMPGFLITAFGKAMQDGRAGDYIKVRNVDSQRIILAMINEDGTVKPAF